MINVDVAIQPVVLRFSLIGNEISYHFAVGADAQLDEMEKRFGIDPATNTVFDSNLGFLPVATTLLIRGEKTIVVDPGNHHTSSYGILPGALSNLGVAVEDVDIVVATHSHHDHIAGASVFTGAELVVGAGEIDFAHQIYGPAKTEAMVEGLNVREVPTGGQVELCPGVFAVSTPGHTPGSISVLVESGPERYLATGDAAMTRKEFETQQLGHWYTGAQREEMARSLQLLRDLRPTMVFPGHDRAFRPGASS
ncbi:MAG TPA: MBL fold metallo-hydrolase [Beutenbergiaceae bacterium]|nr:MBL fold metallo-hydrolase [Beutenbergiaceae bacterium]